MQQVIAQQHDGEKQKQKRIVGKDQAYILFSSADLPA